MLRRTASGDVDLWGYRMFREGKRDVGNRHWASRSGKIFQEEIIKWNDMGDVVIGDQYASGQVNTVKRKFNWSLRLDDYIPSPPHLI